ncbi:Plant intracellular Ras-group-related LRR protein 8 [Capsicum baccatum]|uniref:Plant intracellular Ras-group-related LRR protein 8 n=1 Tax=Capsicum baccatum TaxID=33114 RepID=A0A2G2WHU4_CAPBA|nr:Plant intracellular Ras-group-related LRR protein 8 [Capsicum baccatum]
MVVSTNLILGLPSEIGQLTSLEVLKVNNNRIHSIPENIGGCASLVEVDLSSNLLVELPETISKLKDLKYAFAPIICVTHVPTTGAGTLS